MKNTKMGGDIICIEPLMIEDGAQKSLTWYMLNEGALVLFMEAMNGYDESCSLQFVNSWEDKRVTTNGITF